MSLSTYYLEYGQFCRHPAYAPTSNTASHDNHEKINSWVSFSFLYEYGAPLGGPSGRRSSAINIHTPPTEGIEISRVVGGLRKKKPFCGQGMDIFWNYTM